MVKLYLQEPDSDSVTKMVIQADSIATTWAAYVEVRAALARASRAGRILAVNYATVVDDFERDWQTYTRSKSPGPSSWRRAN